MINSIEDFIKFTEKPTIEAPFVYRGQSNKNWGLVPSLFRVPTLIQMIEINGNIKSKWQEIEDRLMKKFKTHSLPLTKEKPKGYIDWLTLAQHHGLPTRLLDWSMNPLVALFFAVDNLSTDDGIIYKERPFLNYHLDTLNTGIFKETNDYGFVYPNHYSQRVNVQKGCFSLHKYPKGNNDFIPHNKILDNGSTSPSSVIIPNKKKFQLKRDLDKLGINSFSLFPDLDGLTTYLKWEHERDLRYKE